MTDSGIEYTEKLDLVTEGNDYVNLVIVQTNEFTDDLFQNFQDKLNSYLAFALDGQLYKSYPETKGKQVRITMDIYCSISESALSLLQRAKEAVQTKGIDFFWEEKELPNG